MLLEGLNEEEVAVSSESSGMGSGGGNWMLVKSGKEPPVLWAAGLSVGVSCWSGDGNMLQKKDGCSELIRDDDLNLKNHLFDEIKNRNRSRLIY